MDGRETILKEFEIQIAANLNRGSKVDDRHQSVDDLMYRWDLVVWYQQYFVLYRWVNCMDLMTTTSSIHLWVYGRHYVSQ